ncbi:MAG: hypothetical protein RLZZ248_619 [Bacteroidota bacterium]|jgi:hypothetical protein
MKIRIADNELRFRIDPQDLLLLKEKKELNTTISISHNVTFHCILSLRDDLEQPLISMSDFKLHLHLPSVETSQWLKSDKEITLYKNLLLANSPTVLTVEKDLPCKH